MKCHGPAMQLGKLDLRNRAAAIKGGEKGPAFTPGNAAQSILYKRVAGLEKPVMPMDGKLTTAEVESLRVWIDQGAAWDAELTSKSAKDPLKEYEESKLPAGAREFWSFQKPVKRDPPAATDARFNDNPIDRFLFGEWIKRGLKPAPVADKRTLLRRAYLDLTGLPPTPEEAKAFLNDNTAEAWPKLIDRLLASPHYGERWGRHWLDVARYADSNGYEHDFDRPNAWRFRDYVIRAFNRDTPFNRFLLEQLAGDEVDDVTYDTLTATGFLRNYAKVGFREKDNPQFRYDYLDDMIATLGRGVMGLTVHCARCHNHKFDPILQRDYYRLQTSLFSYVEVDHPLVPKEQADAYYRQQAEVDAKIAPLRQAIAAIEDPYKLELVKLKYTRFPQNVQDAIATPEDKRTEGQTLLANQVIRTTRVSSAEVARHLKPEEAVEVKRLNREIAALEKQRPAPIPTAMGITDGDYRLTPDGAGDEPAPGKGGKREVVEGTFLHTGPGAYKAPPAHFLHGGDMYSRGSIMKPGFLTVLNGDTAPAELPPSHHRTSGRRRALAEWLTSADHPLTSRVIVNRVWHHHFGRGIVPTIDNFGHTGEKPSHPDLLDWLAVDFRESGWSFKRLHRLILTSQAYQMASSWADAGNVAKDTDNTYLWRFRQQRLEAEILRDSVLAVAGSLNTLMEGPAVFPQLPEESLKSMKNGIWKVQQEGPDTWRRSIYVYRKRGLPFPFFEVFDLPDQTLTCGRRNVSTVATQALTLLNNEFVLNQARRFAERIKALAPGDANEQLQIAYELALSRPPNAEERRVAQEFLQKNTLEDFAHVLLNLNEFVYLR
ncbi:MAG: PSD1 domain-containing protein [Bryobacterales bacterium]|nr:PSD1 domain-containing protein [Bryobacterales bacterium]